MMAKASKNMPSEFLCQPVNYRVYKSMLLGHYFMGVMKTSSLASSTSSKWTALKMSKLMPSVYRNSPERAI